MVIARCVRIFIYVYVLIHFSVDVSRSAAYDCDKTNFLQYAQYSRLTSQMTGVLRTSETQSYVRLDNDRLVVLCPWINDSDLKVERDLMELQVRTLRELISIWRDSLSFSFEVTVTDVATRVRVSAGSSYITWNLDSSLSVTEWGGSEENIFNPYVPKDRLTAFHRSRDTVLSRWRDACRKTKEMDTSENMNVTFVYNVDRSTFECSVASVVPTYYVFNLDCVGSNGEGRKTAKRSDATAGIYKIFWTDPRCQITGANCTVESMSDCKVVISLKASEGDPVLATHLSGIGVSSTTDAYSIVVNDAVQASDVGVSVSVSFFMIVLVLGLLVYGVCRYRSSTGSGWRHLSGHLKGSVC